MGSVISDGKRQRQQIRAVWAACDAMRKYVSADDDSALIWAIDDLYVLDFAAQVLGGDLRDNDIDMLYAVLNRAAYGAMSRWDDCDIAMPQWAVELLNLITVVCGENDHGSYMHHMARYLTHRPQ